MGRERIGEVCEFLPLLAEDEAGVIHPTNGFVFLLGKDPFLSHIQCGMFKGTTRAVFVDKREYGGALWEQVEDAFQFVLRNIHLGACKCQALFCIVR